MNRFDKIFLGLWVAGGLFIISAGAYHEYKYDCIKWRKQAQMSFHPGFEVMMPDTVCVCEQEITREDYNKKYNTK